TGGAQKYREFVAPLEAVRGRHELYLVVRASLDAPVGHVDWLRLDKAADTQDLSFLGVPPLKDKLGRLVLPQPTHRPRSRPADKYGHTAASGRPPAPALVAARLAKPPRVDGKLDEWTPAGTAMRQARDGYESLAPESKIWAAYDEQALYIAARHPLERDDVLSFSTRRLGASDCMEIALCDPRRGQPGWTIHLCGWPDGQFVATDLGGAPAAAVAALQKAVTYQAQVSAEAWTCEWRVPFAVCGFTPATAPILRFNAGLTRTSDHCFVALRGTGGGIYEAMSCGAILAFEGATSWMDVLPKDGLEVWLDASDAETVSADQTGRVESWADKSGKGRHATQQVPEYRPFYVRDGINGRPALRFDDELLTRLQLPDLAEGKINATILAVVSNPQPGLPANHDPRIFTASDGQGYDYIVGLCCSIPGLETGGPRIIATQHKDRWAKYVRIGCFSPRYQTFLKGYVGEILVYSRILKQEEQDLVRTYLTAKWGLEH
ncbi:MAG: hypothetical protein H5T86_14795, partial [Armatimonadetes bacterium]|nr:hypothetical protein [Armatimonadota bacterium]